MQIDNIILNADVREIIEELRSQLYAQGIQLFAKVFDSGDDLMVCCPYHKGGQERKPSAGIRKSDGMFHCLACGEAKPLYEMISDCFGYNDPFGFQGKKWLINNFATAEVQSRATIKIDLERNNISDKSSVLDNSADNKLLCVSEEELDSYRYTHPYMYKRGLTDEVIDLFDIGYDKTTDSITFPVRYWGSMNFGQCMFVAKRRIKQKRFDLPSNIEKPLYGLYEVWESIHSAQMLSEIYVVEGLFDCLRLWAVGKYAVAGFGCNFSQYQITLLEGLPTRKLILATDNDDAGYTARLKLKRALSTKLITEVVLPENRKDIGECTDEELSNLIEIF